MDTGLGSELREGVLTLTLDRPPGNRVSLSLISALTEALANTAASPNVRAVHLRATGPDFSAGADLRDPELATLIAGGPKGQRELAHHGATLLDTLARLPIPTVVSARGDAIGAGACLWVAADFRWSNHSFRIHFPEVDRGMHLSWGVLPRLGRELGWPTARRLALGQPLDASSLPRDVAEFTEDPDAPAAEWARALAQKPPLAVRAILETFREVDRVDAALASADADRFAVTCGSADFLEAMSAFFEHRPGRYTGR
jgi:enoyl-CoA hydratase/carnithine racemase